MIFSKILSAPGERHDRTVSHQNVISVKLLQSRFIQKYYRGFSSVLSFSIPILSSDFCLLTPQVFHMLSRLTGSRIMGSASTSALIGCRSWPPWPWVRFLSGFMVAISMPVSLLRRMRPVWTYCWLSVLYCIEYTRIVWGGGKSSHFHQVGQLCFKCIFPIILSSYHHSYLPSLP